MGTDGLTKYEGGVPPQPVAGSSALTLVLRGIFIELFGCLMIIPMVIAAVGHHNVWTGFFLSIGVVAAVVGGIVSIRGYRKALQEIRLGYVTIPQFATRIPPLYLLHRLDYHVMLYPNQPRPRSRNKKDMEAWRAQFDYPENAGS